MAVYWVGANGNVYIKDNSGVRDVGKAIGVSDKGFDAQKLSAQATRIADPNPPKQTAPAPSNPNGTSSSSSSAVKPDKSNDIALQLSGLGAVDQQTNAGLGSINDALSKLIGQYSTEATSNEGNYNDQSTTNRTNLQKNKQSAYVNAAQGRQGLFGTLASLGALNGSGIDLANNAVQKGANEDLSGAADNFSTNQQQLDTAIGTFRNEDKQRRQNAETAANNARTNVQNQAAKNRMSFLSNLANDYADMGDTGNAQKYSSQAASLYPQVAATSVPDSNIAYSGAAFTPGTLASYMAGSNNETVNTTPSTDGSTPGLVATLANKKKQTQGA